MKNLDTKTIDSFGDEWMRFNQTGMPDQESQKIFNEYFAIFPWDTLPADAEGFDMGCGSGRWARWVAPRVGHLHCIDPSSAINVARKNLGVRNVEFHQASVDQSGLLPFSQDFGYSLGVLHHVPDTAAAIRSCAELLKPGAPLLLYLYYAFDNRPWWFRALWGVSERIRHVVRRLSPGLKHKVTDAIALFIYWPLSRFSLLLENLKLPVYNIPLSYYRHHSLYTLRTDARDRFGTPLEQRFTQDMIKSMMHNAGLSDIQFSRSAPYWCVVGIKNQ